MPSFRVNYRKTIDGYVILDAENAEEAKRKVDSDDYSGRNNYEIDAQVETFEVEEA